MTCWDSDDAVRAVGTGFGGAGMGFGGAGQGRRRVWCLRRCWWGCVSGELWDKKGLRKTYYLNVSSSCRTGTWTSTG